MTSQPKPRGTTTAYERHLLHREKPCAACRAANAKAVREAPHGRIMHAAKMELARRHPDEFEALAETDGGPRERTRARAELARRYPDVYRALLTEGHLKHALGQPDGDR